MWIVYQSSLPNGHIAQALFTPNRPYIVPGGLAAVEEALQLNKNGASGRKVVIRPHDAIEMG
jgi:hypothetical protein